MKKISLKDVKNGLKRDEMRMILGGCGSGLKKCCWTVDHTNCSICNTGTSCVANAILLDC